MAITFYNETMSKIGYKRDHLRASMRLRQYQVFLNYLQFTFTENCYPPFNVRQLISGYTITHNN